MRVSAAASPTHTVLGTERLGRLVRHIDDHPVRVVQLEDAEPDPVGQPEAGADVGLEVLTELDLPQRRQARD